MMYDADRTVGDAERSDSCCFDIIAVRSLCGRQGELTACLYIRGWTRAKGVTVNRQNASTKARRRKKNDCGKKIRTTELVAGTRISNERLPRER
jgi:hypothetical protein